MRKVGPGLYLRSVVVPTVSETDGSEKEPVGGEEGGCAQAQQTEVLEERELVRHGITHRLLVVARRAAEPLHVLDPAAVESLGLQSKRVEVRRKAKKTKNKKSSKKANEGEMDASADKGKDKYENKEEGNNNSKSPPQWVEECREFVAKAALETSEGAVLVEGDPAASCGAVLACLLLLPALTRSAAAATDATDAEQTKKKNKGKKGDKKDKKKNPSDDEPIATLLTYDDALKLLERKCGGPLPDLPRGVVAALKAIVAARPTSDASVAAAHSEPAAEENGANSANSDAESHDGEDAAPAIAVVVDKALSAPLPAVVVADIEPQLEAIPRPATPVPSRASGFFSGVVATLRRVSKSRSNENLPVVAPTHRHTHSGPGAPQPTSASLPVSASVTPASADSAGSASASGSSAPPSPALRRSLAGGGQPAAAPAGNAGGGLPPIRSSADTPASWFNTTSGQPPLNSSGPQEPLAYVRRNNRTSDKPDPSDRIYKLGDLPRDVRSQVLATKIPFDELERHFDIVLNILFFNKKVELPRRPRRVTTQAEQQPQLEQAEQQPAEQDAPPAMVGTAFAAKTEEELLNTTINPKKAFKFICMTGEGGYGKVWTAKSDVPEFRGKVAVKRLQHVEPKEKKHNINEMSFLSFCKHPNIVTYYTSLLLKNELMIVMEHMEGGTLTEATKGHNFTELQIAYVARELLSALVYLHDNKLAHRDLKSGNIMMTIKGQIKLIDFGLCVDVASGPRNDMVGSPFWMAPEMVGRRPHSTPVDIWSFAISLLELANKDPPHRKSSIKCMFTFGTVGCPDPLNEPAKWSPTFKDFLAQCLQVDPAQRATARQLLRHPFVLKTAAQKQMAHLINQIFMQTAISQVVIT